MKKIFYLASIAALALSSCTKDETTQAVIDNAGGGSKIMATAQGDATRTHLELGANGNYEFRWSENDVLGVFGDGANSAHNVPFSLLDGYSDQAEGIFESNYKLLNGSNFMAYYPFVPGATIDNPTTDLFVYDSKTKAATQLKTSNINLFQINKEQNYKPGSFNTFTAPAVSDKFVVDEDGNADVTMQPVADYLYVNLRGTENIQTVTLKLWTADFDKYVEVNDGQGYWIYVGDDRTRPEQGYDRGYFGRWNPYTKFPGTTADDWKWIQPKKEVATYKDFRPVQITGKGTLKSYTYIDADKNKSTRYYLSNEGMRGGNEITLRTGQLTDIVCHDPNTYAFVVPAGILGMNPGLTTAPEVGQRNVVAQIIVNEGLELADGTDIEQTLWFGGKSLNGGYAEKADGSDDTTKPMWRQWNEDGSSNYKMENTVFFANESVMGVRTSDLYNPTFDFIIYDEVDFLQYMNEYATWSQVGYRNAYVCTEHSFDFSRENMGKLATEIKKSNNTTDGAKLRGYIDDYVANGVPCIEDYYSKFKGNGAVFTAMKVLQSKDGLFGELHSKAVIENITFENLVGKEYRGEALYHPDGKPVTNDKGQQQYATAVGVVLAQNAEAGTIKNVGIVNPTASAIIGTGDVANYEGLVLEDVDALDMIFATLNMEKDLTFKNWDVASTVAKDVFGVVNATVVPVQNVNDGHHVVTIAKGDADEYDMLAGVVTAYRNNSQAVSVVIENVSYWTGSTIADGAYSLDGKTYGLAYAEQLAAGNPNNVTATMLRNMDANFDNIEISWPNLVPYAALNGAGNTVKGIVLNTTVEPNAKEVAKWAINADDVDGVEVAPFKVPAVANITFDGIEINLEADNVEKITVPGYVGGVTNYATTISGVKVNGLDINTYEVSQSLNGDAYYDAVVPVVGWIASTGLNTQVANTAANVTGNELLGIAGLVGQINVTNSDSNFNAVSVVATGLAQEDIDLFTKEDMDPEKMKIKNAAGTMVGHVINNEANDTHGIEFINSGKPVFLYSVATGAQIVVYYDNLDEVVLK